MWGEFLGDDYQTANKLPTKWNAAIGDSALVDKQYVHLSTAY
jgi:hypothetical protein